MGIETTGERRRLVALAWLLSLSLFGFCSVTGYSQVKYFPETIDSVKYSTRLNVQITGIVGGVEIDTDDKLGRVVKFRLLDSDGHYVYCVVKPELQPRVGAEILIYGTRKVVGINYQGEMKVEINPVDKLEPVEQ